MPKTSGYDGSIILGTVNSIEFKQGTANITRVVADVSGFSGRGRERRLGKWDINLSFSGTPKNGSTNQISAMTNTVITTTFAIYGTNTSTYYGVAFDSVLSDISLGSVHDADNTVSGNAQLSTASTSEPPFTVYWQS